MNRREAIAALISLPEVARISTVPASSDDVIVVECDAVLSDDTIARLKATLQHVWPNRKIVVLGENVRLKVAPK